MASNPGQLVITDEVAAVRKEAQRLTSQGVDIIIAVGHAGFRKDMDIAKNIPEVDVVVGGHTNTFLFNGKYKSPNVLKYKYKNTMSF